MWTPKDWTAVTPGGSVTIPWTGWATAAAPDWLLYPHVALASSGFQSVTSASLHLTTDLGVGTSGTCSARQAMNAGHTGTLEVPVPSAAQSGDYLVLSIESFHEKPSPSCWPPLAEDQYHFALVGLYVP